MITSGDKLVQQQAELVDAMLRMRISTIYSGYWVCDSVIFQSDEKIICAALKLDMSPDVTRYTPYKYIVEKSKRVAYVFTVNNVFHPQATIEKFARDHRYSQVRINNYIVFIPVQS